MATDPNIIPIVDPSNLLSVLDGQQFNIRFISPDDKVHHSFINRPLLDIEARQLLITKSIAYFREKVARSSTYPFVLTPELIGNGSNTIGLPSYLFYDMRVTWSGQWIEPRLIRVDKIGGVLLSSGYTGILRFIFGAKNVTTEIVEAMFYVDVDLSSQLKYQLVSIEYASGITGIPVADPSLSDTVAGAVIFITPDQSNSIINEFLQFVFAEPSITQFLVQDYIASTAPIKFSDTDYQYGTGLLQPSASNIIPPSTTSQVSGQLDMDGFKVTNLGNGEAHGDAVNFGQLSDFLDRDGVREWRGGGTDTPLNMNGHRITGLSDPTGSSDAVSKQFFDNNVVDNDLVFIKDGSVVATGEFNLGSNKIINLSDGVDDQDAVTVQQLNNAVSATAVSYFSYVDRYASTSTGNDTGAIMLLGVSSLGAAVPQEITSQSVSAGVWLVSVAFRAEPTSMASNNYTRAVRVVVNGLYIIIIMTPVLNQSEIMNITFPFTVTNTGEFADTIRLEAGIVAYNGIVTGATGTPSASVGLATTDKIAVRYISVSGIKVS